MMFLENIGKKMVKGAKEEIQDNPPALINTDNLVDFGELLLGIGIVVFAIFGGGRGKPAAPAPIIINNYITK